VEAIPGLFYFSGSRSRQKFQRLENKNPRAWNFIFKADNLNSKPSDFFAQKRVLKIPNTYKKTARTIGQNVGLLPEASPQKEGSAAQKHNTEGRRCGPPTTGVLSQKCKARNVCRTSGAIL